MEKYRTEYGTMCMNLQDYQQGYGNYKNIQWKSRGNKHAFKDEFFLVKLPRLNITEKRISEIGAGST